MNTETLWKTILADLELEVSKPVFQTFLSQTKLLELNGQTATIGCTQPMLINLIETRYQSLLKKMLDTYTKMDTRLVFTAAPRQTGKNIDGPLFTLKTPAHDASPSRIRLNPEYTFANFAVSTSNQMAYAAATAVAKSPGVSYNPLFLYGGVGVGKTHLMQAVAHEIIRQNPAARLIYCTGEEFTNEIIEAIGTKTTVNFKKKYRKLNIFLIDDIQFIAGKNAVQEEFFHTFNAIQQMGGQIVMTSDRSPDEINRLEERLRSRFEGGLTIDIGQPDFELRCAILLIKAKQRGYDLPIETAKLMATNVENPRKLEGVLIRVITESQMNNVPISGSLINNVLGSQIKETDKKNGVKPDKVIEAVADYFHIKPSQLKGDRRDRMLATPRQILYFLFRSEFNLPLMEIGGILGGRDHTTIMYGIKKVSNLMLTDRKMSADILGIKAKLFG